jgi:hypothetical protein
MRFLDGEDDWQVWECYINVSLTQGGIQTGDPPCTKFVYVALTWHGVCSDEHHHKIPSQTRGGGTRRVVDPSGAYSTAASLWKMHALVGPPRTSLYWVSRNLLLYSAACLRDSAAIFVLQPALQRDEYWNSKRPTSSFHCHSTEIHVQSVTAWLLILWVQIIENSLKCAQFWRNLISEKGINYCPTNPFRSRGSSVYKCLTMNWRTGRSRFDPRQWQKIFPLASLSRPALRPTQPPIQWLSGVLSSGAKRGRGVTLITHLQLTIAEVNNE